MAKVLFTLAVLLGAGGIGIGGAGPQGGLASLDVCEHCLKAYIEDKEPEYPRRGKKASRQAAVEAKKGLKIVDQAIAPLKESKSNYPDEDERCWRAAADLLDFIQDRKCLTRGWHWMRRVAHHMSTVAVSAPLRPECSIALLVIQSYALSFSYTFALLCSV
jgi:hypothetical protein